MQRKIRGRTAGYLFFYTAGFLVAALLIVGIFQKENISFIRMTDGVAQHFAVLTYFRRCLLQVLHGDFSFPMMDFSIGQGFDLLGTLNYYGVGDPVNLLTVLFPADHLEEMYAFLILLRMYLAGVTFAVYCRCAGITKRSAILCGAWLYAFCGFVLIGGMKHPIFLSGFVYLPLLLASIERLMQGGSIRFLAVSVALAFLSNYYFMYMNTVLCGIYVLIRFSGNYRAYGVRGIGMRIGKIAGAWLWGVGLGAVVLFPSVYAFLHNARIQDGSSTALLYTAAHYRKMFLSFFLSMPMTNGWTVPATAAGGVTGILMLFAGKKGTGQDRQLKAGFLLLLLMLCIPAAGKVMNGLAYATNRWSYGMAFLCALMAVRAVCLLKEQRTGIFLLLALAAGIVASLLAGSYRWIVWRSVAVFALTVLAFAGGAVLEKKKKSRLAGMLVSTVVLCGVCWNLLSFFTPLGFHYAQRFQTKGRAEAMLENEQVKALQKATEKDTQGFYRVELPSSLLNRSLVTGLHGTSFYYSVVPKEMKNQYASLGLSKYVRPYVLPGLENHQILLNLSGVKYRADGTDGTVTVNEDALPLGYTYDQTISLADYEKLTPLERQVALLQYAVLDEQGKEIQKRQGTTLENKDSVLAGSVKKQELKTVKSERVSYKNKKLKAKKGGRLTLAFTCEEPSECYLVLKGLSAGARKRLKHALSVWYKKQQMEVGVAGTYGESSMQRSVIAVNLGMQKKGEGRCTLRFKKKASYRLEGMEIWSISEDAIRKLTRERKAESLREVTCTANRITGKIRVSKDKILQLSVPYSKGWSIYVDGKKTGFFTSGVAYTGLKVEKGEHFIEMKYVSPWIVPGAVVSILSGAALAVSFVASRKKKRSSL